MDPHDAAERQICITRDVSAPSALVWEVLTRGDHLARWWGPSGFTTETHELDLRPGGRWRLTMHGPDGRAYLNHVVYDEVDPPRRLVLRYLVEPDAEPVLHVTTLTLAELSAGRTRVTLRLDFPTAELRRVAVERYGALDGGAQTLGRLAELLAALQGGDEPDDTFVLRRVLAAPVPLVWSAWTEAEHLLRWFHPEVWRLFVAELDLRVGGTFFYGMRGEGMAYMWGLWRFTEVEPPRRLSFLLSFSDPDRQITRAPWDALWPQDTETTLTLEPHAGIGGGTVLTLRQRPVGATDAERAQFRGGFASMREGWGQTLDQLAAFVVTPR